MVWLIGNRGMLGRDVEKLLDEMRIQCNGTDLDLNIVNVDALSSYATGKGFKWVINCAAYTNVDTAEDEREHVYRINTDGVMNIAQVTQEIGAKLIHISTDYVFDGNKEKAYIESDSPNPLNVYGSSKLEGERKLKQIMSKYFILRTAWLYGVHGDNFVYTMLRFFNERDKVAVVSDQWGSPTHTMDLARAICTVIMRASSKYGIYHAANEGKTSWYGFAKAIYKEGRLLGLVKSEVDILPTSSKDYSAKATRPRNSYLSKDKFESTFHYSFPTWQAGLESFLHILVQNKRVAQ